LSFLAYVEQILLPTLAPGDIVIMDNLGSHKRKAIPSGFSLTCVVIVLSGFPDVACFISGRIGVGPACPRLFERSLKDGPNHQSQQDGNGPRKR
jgi:hypothetical protein